MSSALISTSSARPRPMSRGNRAMGPATRDEAHAHLPLRQKRVLSDVPVPHPQRVQRAHLPSRPQSRTAGPTISASARSGQTVGCCPHRSHSPARGSCLPRPNAPTCSSTSPILHPAPSSRCGTRRRLRSTAPTSIQETPAPRTSTDCCRIQKCFASAFVEGRRNRRTVPPTARVRLPAHRAPAR